MASETLRAILDATGRFLTAAALAGAVTLSISAPLARAAEIKTLDISRQQDTYRVSFDAVVDAPVEKVYRLLSDYAHFESLSPVIVALTVEPAPQGAGERIRSVLKSCFLVFCREVVEVADVTEPDGHTIAAEIVPDEGDFHSGHSRWRIEADGARTRLHYEATRTPSFRIPTLLGRWVIRATVRDQLRWSVARLEQVINQNAIAEP